MLKCLIPFYCLLMHWAVISQEESHEVPKGFKSMREYELITNTQTEHLELLLLLNDDLSEEFFANAQETLTRFFDELREKNISKLSEVRQIKRLQEEIHSKFLKKYEPISPFHEILESGTYNCVSATALFALGLEEFKIPYAIQELPTHVFLIAYPKTKGIVVEMTTPKNGYYMPKRKDIGKTVDELVTNKLVSREELASKGERAVYNDFFYRKETISLRQLAGLQFYNEAIIHFDEDAQDAAYSSIKKSNVLYGKETDKSAFFQIEILISMLKNAKFEELKDFQYLVEYAELPESNEEKVVYEFANAIQRKLIEGSKKKLIDSAFAYMHHHVSDTSLNKRLSQIYYLGLSDYYGKAYNLKKQKRYAEKAHLINPENMNAQARLIQCVVMDMNGDFDDESFIQKLEDEADKFPFMKNHNRYLMLLFYGYAEMSSEEYFANDEASGRTYFDKAMDVYHRMEDPDVLNEKLVGHLFAKAASYHYRQKEYDRSMNLLNQGLKLVPKNEEILSKMEIVQSKM